MLLISLSFLPFGRSLFNKNMTLLYTCDEEDLTDSDLLRALREVGVAEGDMLFIHSDIAVFGKLATPNKDTFLSALIETFKESVGEDGTVTFPAFSFSWGKGEAFDVQKSRSTVGSLSEFFRQQPGVKRSLQPMHSIAAWGKRTNEVLTISKDTFGKGSVFDNLRKLNAKIVMFGVDFEYCTFLIHVEQMHKVPYRFLKTFTGSIIEGNETRKDWCTYFARPLEQEVDNEMQKIEPHLRASHALHEKTFGNGTIKVVRAADLYDIAMRLLDEDPYFLLAQHSIDKLRGNV
ncbi:aminoglycoside N(3)-acetyltransferase [Candidatus Parcubacteria bacterium]|nr:MAG: aminoglycoside N(3)-acetyltransferase [Candidatus Parcubacteria bacterium]